MAIITENYPVISILNFWFFYQTARKGGGTFDRRKNYNGVKNSGKICFTEDIDVFIRMYKLINLQNKANSELK